MCNFQHETLPENVKVPLERKVRKPQEKPVELMPLPKLSKNTKAVLMTLEESLKLQKIQAEREKEIRVCCETILD